MAEPVNNDDKVRGDEGSCAEVALDSPRVTVNNVQMRAFTILCLFLIVAVAVGVSWLHMSEHFAAKVGTALGIVIVLAIAALWAVCRFGGSTKTKIAALAAGGLLLAGSTQLFRYDGSTDGSSLPRFAWRWAPEKGAGLDDLSGLAPAVAAASDDWKPSGVYRDYSGYLGPERTGSIDGIILETDWVAHPPQELWRIEMGLGWSGFAVSGRHAITQEQRDAFEMVTCYNFETGAPIWAHRNEARFSEPMGGDGPRATPQIDGDRVYALGATGILDCLEVATGKLHWSRDTLVENGAKNPEYGKSGSPLIVGSAVIVTGGDKGPLLMAYHKDTGEPIWKNGTDAAGYAAPVLAMLAGAEHIVVINGESVTGHDSTTGAEQWRWDWPGTFPRPGQPWIMDGNRILLTASYNLGCHLLQIARSESDGAFAVSEIWESSRLKTKFSSACVKDGYAYGLDEGRLACINLEDGSRKWKDGRYGFGQNLLVGDVLLVQAERGQVVLVEATPEGHTELATLDALTSSTKTWNTPTLAGSYLLVRNDVEAACYRIPVVQAGGVSAPKLP